MCTAFAGIKKHHPQLWREVKLGLHQEEHLTTYLEVMASADEVRLAGIAVTSLSSQNA